MKNGYLLTFTDDARVEVFANGAGKLVFSLDETEVSIENGQFNVRASIVNSENFLSLKNISKIEIEFNEENKAPEESLEESTDSEITRRCINCNGRRYCITGGCANTPCGWICD